eukprot:CAMPEP_0202726768 /NCGR_PEP_ID=MMETSP1385-20130828/184781_1 /ASSEMBLY_ACC=CAM_ASM_000861 /TAXON_ID=933848 /ORGANISM="Elphidium margaritaceum" /LENGTH=1774 /DNA_ID=CAMNT_0049392995 /DNA_START=32 /DNA_END=5356 /DNA_ORIENTATION=-
MSLQLAGIKRPQRRLSQMNKKDVLADTAMDEDDDASIPDTMEEEDEEGDIDDEEEELDTEEQEQEPEQEQEQEFEPELEMSYGENIQCMVRVRPILSGMEQTGRQCVDVNEALNSINIDCKPRPKAFTFDYVSSPTSTQESIFQRVGKPISNACLAGYNGTIFAYGQTGSGKTYTILGDFEDRNSSSRGVMPRVFDYLFCCIQRDRNKHGDDVVEYLVKGSCLEIYNERIQDLLEPDRCNLQIREDYKRGVMVEGISQRIVENANDALKLMEESARNRRVSETSMNKESSRSHLMFTLSIECRMTESNQLRRTRTSRFNLVDLAGSERQSKTHATGDRLREAGNINKSLTVLGHVMKALVQQNIVASNAAANGEENTKHTHIHYRDSKLTHLLKDSLGGNSLTFMVACVSPSSMNLLESLSTLQFASRAKYIKNKAQLNEDQSGSVKVLKSENKKLINQVARLQQLIERGGASGSQTPKRMDSGDGGGGGNSGQLKDAMQVLEVENYGIRREREKYRLQVDEMQRLVEKKKQFILNLKMQLKLRQAEAMQLRQTVAATAADDGDGKNGDDGDGNGEGELPLSPHKKSIAAMTTTTTTTSLRGGECLGACKSAVIEEHLKTIELQQQSQEMMDFIHRFVNDEDNKMRMDQYQKWKHLYATLIDENHELRSNAQQKTDTTTTETETQSQSAMNDDAKSCKEQCKQQLTAIQTDMDALRHKHDELQTMYGELESKMKLQQRSHINEKEAMKCETEKQLENMRLGAVAALDSNTEQTMELSLKMSEMTAKLDVTEAELQTTQQHNREQLKQIAELTEKCEQGTQEIQSTRVALNEKETNVSVLRQELERLQSAQNEWLTQTQCYEQQVDEKQAQMHRLQSEMDSITQQFEDVKLQYSSLQDDHQILSDVQETLEYQKTEQQQKLTQYETQIEQLQQKQSALTQEIVNKSEIICTLQNEVSQKMESADETVKNLNEKNENYSKTIAEMNSEMECLRQSIDDSANEMLRKDIDIEALRREMQHVNVQLNDYKTAHNELEKKYTAYIEKYKNVQNEYDEVQRMCEQYQSQCREKHSDLETALQEKQSLLSAIDKLQTDVHQMQHEYDVLQTQCEEKGNTIGKHEEMLQARVEEIEQLQQNIVRLEQEIQAQKQAMHVALQTAENDRENEKEKIQQQHETEMKGLQQTVEALTAMHVALQTAENDREHEKEKIQQQHETKLKGLQQTVEALNAEKLKLEKDCAGLSQKLENEKCKVREKEETFQVLQRKIAQFQISSSQSQQSENNDSAAADGGSDIQSQMMELFEKFDHEKQTLNAEIKSLTDENSAYHAEIETLNRTIQQVQTEKDELVKTKTSAQQMFEQHKKNMCLQLEKAHNDVQQRQERSERLIKTFEQRLELRQKQNVDYRQKIDALSAEVTAKTSEIQKQTDEIEQIKTQLKRCQNTIHNAQSLNESLLQEKSEFDTKLQASEQEVERMNAECTHFQTELNKCMQERMNAIKTSKRMRLAEEKAYNEMMEWKSQYSTLQETSNRLEMEMHELKKQNDNLAVENSKLAGHHNAQQRINHLLNLKRECEKLKREKKQMAIKLSQFGGSSSGGGGRASVSGGGANHKVSDEESVSDKEEREKENELMNQTMLRLLHAIKNISELSVVEEQTGFVLQVNTTQNCVTTPINVEQPMQVLTAIQNVIHDQNNQIIRLKREIHGLSNDVSIRDEQIKVLNDHITLSPSLSITQSGRKTSKTKRKRAVSSLPHPQVSPDRNTSDKENRKRRTSTDTFTFESS